MQSHPTTSTSHTRETHNGQGTRPLTRTQQAYLSGRADGQLYGGVDCLALFEFTGTPIDPTRMRAAIHTLRRHPVLRSTIIDGHHVDQGHHAQPPLTITETTGTGTHDDLTTYLANHRRDILSRHANHTTGEAGWVDILHWHTTDGHDLGVLHIGLSLAIADLLGAGIIVRELATAYRATTHTTNADTTTGPWITFPDITTREHDNKPTTPTTATSTPTDNQPPHPDPLPAGPDIPLIGTPQRTVTRHTRRLDHTAWDAIGTVATTIGATRPGLLLALYRHALALWCNDDNFTIIIPGLDARHTPNDVLDRTRTWAVRPPSATGKTLRDAATDATTEIRHRIHIGLDSTEEVRNLLHQGEGHTGILPFVLTCGGEDMVLTADVIDTFGPLTASGSITPQVLADMQFLNATPDDVYVALDIRDGAFPTPFGPQLLDTVADALERLATLGLDTDNTNHIGEQPIDDIVRLSSTVTHHRNTINNTPPVDSATTTPTLHGAWLRHVTTQPDATAIIDPARETTLTYATLHQAAQRLATHYADDVAPGDLVLIQLPKGRDQITAALAVLYLGAAYLPITIDAPDSRVRTITDTAQPAATITHVDPTIYDNHTPNDTPPNTATLPRPVDPDDRAYVIFTSGSTGTPKGVVMTHRAATNTIAAINEHHNIGPDDSILAVSSLDFDLSVYDIFGMLSAGGTIVCITDDERRDAFAWCDHIRHHAITIWNSAPALADMLTVAADGGPHLPLRRVLVSGDWVPPTLPARIRAITTGDTPDTSGAHVIALGGATEGGIWSNHYTITNPDDLDPTWPSIPYGHPLPGQAYRVVNPTGRDLPDGVVGELWIGGASLATEYLGNNDLTADRFITDTNGTRWYRTGDHGYWDPNGLLFFVGRRDNQVKIRGHRVELGDVEHHLTSIDGIDAAIAIPAPGHTALRALVTLDNQASSANNSAGTPTQASDPHPNTNAAEHHTDAHTPAITADHIRAALATTLPEFMIPRDITIVPHMHLTANGKIDRAWAARFMDGNQATTTPIATENTTEPAPAQDTTTQEPHTTATTTNNISAATTTAVATTWAEALNIPTEELHDLTGHHDTNTANFFALGGDSISATTVCSRLRAQGYRVTIADLFSNPTFHRFTTAVDTAGRDTMNHTPPHTTTDTDTDTGAPFPLTPLQRAYALGTDGIRGTVRAATAYSAILTLPHGEYTPDQARKAATELSTHWPALRIIRDGDDTQRVVTPHDALRVTVLDPSTNLHTYLSTATPQVPLELVLPSKRAHHVGVLIDYLALDGRSLAIIIGALTATLAGTTPDLPSLADPSTTAFANHCHALTAGEKHHPETHHTPAPQPPTLPLRPGHSPVLDGPTAPLAAFTSIRAHIPLATLQHTATRAGATTSAVILAAYGSVLAQQSHLDNVGIVVPLTHRPHTNDGRDILGTFSRLGVCTCPATPDPTATSTALATILTEATPTTTTPSTDTETPDHTASGVRAASAGRTGRYPAVFTSVLGYDTTLAAATDTAQPQWSLTRTPGVLIDCQVTTAHTDTIEVRWDMPTGVLDHNAINHMFHDMITQLGGTVLPHTDTPNDKQSAPATKTQPRRGTPGTVSDLLTNTLSHLDATGDKAHQAGTSTDDDILPWAQPIVDAWRQFTTSEPQTTGLADAPVTWSPADAQLLADIVRGRARRFSILDHPVLAPRALGAAEPTVAHALAVLNDRITHRSDRGDDVAVVELGYGIPTTHQHRAPHDPAPATTTHSWTVIEPDDLIADIATVDGRTCIPDATALTTPADIIIACGTLHRDPRLRAELDAVPMAPGAEIHLIEAEQPTAATLISAALINPAVITTLERDHGPNAANARVHHNNHPSNHAGLLSSDEWAALLTNKGLRIRYLDVEDGHTIILRATTPDTPTNPSMIDTATDTTTVPTLTTRAVSVTSTDSTDSTDNHPDITAILAASWRRHLPGLNDNTHDTSDGTHDENAATTDGNTPGLPDDTDFFTAGGDSITATRVLADLRETGVTGLRAVDIFNNPTFGELRDLAHTTSTALSPHPASSTPHSPTTQNKDDNTHPLTRVQQAYLAGQDSEQLLGGAPARCLFTFRAHHLDIDRLETAVRTAVHRHPALRTIITDGPDGTPTATILSPDTTTGHPTGIWAITTDAEADLRNHTPDPHREGPLAVRVSTDTKNTTTIAISMNNLLLDGTSMMLLINDIEDNYTNPSPHPDTTTHDPSDTTLLATYLADRPWLTDATAPVPWHDHMLTTNELTTRLDAVLTELPPAPLIPDHTTLAHLTDTTMARVSATIDAHTWTTIRAQLATRHITPAAGILAAFGRALAANTGDDSLTINLTRFDRDLSVPGIDRALGDFTSLSLAALHHLRATDHTAAQRSAQEALANADDPAHDALRLAARAVHTTGNPAAGLFPVVFTCGLGLTDTTSRTLRERAFGTQIAASSTTPQVVLDLQVADDRDGLHLTADHLTHAVSADLAHRIIDRTVTELTTTVTTPTTPTDTTPTENTAAILAEVWADVLNLTHVTDDTNFFRAGGDSLSATRCISTLRAQGIDAALRTLLTTPTFGDFRDTVISAHKETPPHTPAPTQEHNTTPQPPHTPATPPTEDHTSDDWFDLTDVQAGYLMGRTTIYEDGGVACQGYSEFTLPIDQMDPISAADPATAVRRAWERVVNAHDMLRALIDREGRQRIDHTADTHLRVINIAAGETGTEITAPDPDTARTIVRNDLRERNFPIGKAPMVELALTIGAGDPVLHLSVDLIVTDYVGIRSLIRDLDYCLRHPSQPLDPPAATFRHCLEARARHTATPAGRAARERDTRWWHDRLDSLPPSLTFSPDPDAVCLGGTTRRSHRLDAAAWHGLCTTATHLTVTPSGLVLAAFATAARRYADIDLGGYTPHTPSNTPHTDNSHTTDSALITVTTVDRTPVDDNGPSTADMERIVGDFTSTIVLDLPLGKDLPTTAQTLQSRLFDALDHPAYPGVKVVRDLRRTGGDDRGRIPVVFTSTVGVDAVDPPRLLHPVPGTAISKTPQVLLDVQLTPHGDGVSMDWDSRDGGFHPAVLDALFADVSRMLDHLAQGIIDEPALRTPEPVARTRSMDGRLLHTRFLRAALDDPHAPAVIHGERTISRGDLCAQASEIAAHLPPGHTPVAIALPPSPEQIAAQIAALLTGRAFVPLDPEWPTPRRQAVIDTVQQAYAQDVPLVDPATLRMASHPLTSDGETTTPTRDHDNRSAWRTTVDHALAHPPADDDLAYIIFTSGSTGTPKGVAVTHRQVCTTLDEMEGRLELTSADRVLAVSRPSFDLAVFNVFGVLGAGGAAVLPSCGTVPDPETWSRDLHRHGVTIWNSVPAQLTILLDYLDDAQKDGVFGVEPLPLRVILVSGDRVPTNQPARVRTLAPGVVIDALGGATEGSIWSIVHRCTRDDDPTDGASRTSIPYGRALGHQAVWVLNRDGGQAAIGQRGDIVIAGDGVAHGYLGDPERTAAAFGRHQATGERCYRTGDVGRYLPDGEIEFCGRADDNQVKIRGHRIELGDVEAGLRSIDGVADALAAVTGEGERRELVAVIVPETTSDTVSDDQTTTTSALTSTERDIAPLIDAIMARNQAEALTDAQSRDFRRIHSLVTEAALDAMTAQIARITEADPTTTATRDDIIAGTGAYHHSALVNRWINELERVGRIRLIDDRVSVVDTTTLTGDNTTSTPDHDQWSEIYRLDERAGYGRRQLDYVHSCLTELPGLLDGRVDPLSLLFPEGDMAIARASYGQNRLSTYLNRMCASAITHHARTLTAAGRTCRILEIGAGVGGTTADVIAELPDTGVDYLFTDVSRYFIDAAAHEWPQVRTALFDINTPPEEQGIQPGSLDVVLCANVLHNAQNIDDTLLQIERLLAPGGLLVIIDSTATNAPLMASMEFKEGLGNTTDARVTTGSPFLTFTQWQDAISASPLESIAVLPEPGTVLELGAQHVFIVRKPQPASTVLAGRGLDLDRIRADAIDALPVHMNPRRIQIVDTLPLTTNGKRDRTAVARLVTTDTPPTTPQPSQPSQPTVPPAATTDPVIDAWRDVLDLDPTQPVHEDANFHDLGGDSLLLARCIGQMRRATHRDDLPSWDETLRAIVANPTVDGCRRALGLTTPPEETPQAENSPGRGQATPTPAPSTGPTVTLVDTTPPSPSGTITRPANGPRLTPLLPPPGDEHDSQTTTGEGSGIHDLTVMVHDGSGGTGPYTALLPELAARNVGPVVGIERSAGDNYLTTPPEELFHDLIERYTLSILETGAHRVHVVGYCMGGLLAAGIADRLAACGVDTSATVLSSYRIPFTVHDETILDFSFARLLGSTPQDMGIDLNEEALGRALRAARHDGHDDITTEVLHHYADENLRAQLTDVPPTSADRIDHFLHTDAGAPWSRDTLDALREVYLHSLAAVAAWAEPPITAPVTFLRQRDPLSFLPDLGDDMTAFWADTCRGGLDIIDVDGDHFTCLDTAHAPAVADLVASQSPWSPGHSPMTRTPTPPAHTPHPADNPTSKTGTDPKGKR